VPSEPTWRLLEALRDGDWTTAEGTDTAARRDSAGLVAAHLQWHLERTLRSLPLVDRRGGIPRVDLVGGAPLDADDDPSDGPPRPEEPSEGAPRTGEPAPGAAL
jgi:DNA repair protein RecO (recombination protein O)